MDDFISRSLVLSITDASRAGEARRAALRLAQELGFSETQAGKVGLVVTEAATNIVKHAKDGRILLRKIQEQDIGGLEVLAIDKGPGMANVDKCMQDGYSTAGSPGTGLGAISRLSDYSEVYSQPGKGTVLLAQLWSRPFHKTPQRLLVGAVCAAMVEQDPCGDAWAIRHEDSRTFILVVDGLGHGPMAARAADEALRVFWSAPPTSGVEMIRLMHGAMRSTRGASLAIAEIDYAAGLVRYSGVGNIAGQVWSEGTNRSMVSHNGTVGHELHSVREFTYPWSENAMIIMHSDGVLTRWSLDHYPGLLQRHPAIIAAILYRDFERGRDDVTTLIGRGGKS